MISVIFEVEPHPEHMDDYLAAAIALRSSLEAIDGFISVERFESITQPGKLLSLSFWRDEEAVQRWRTLEVHRQTQALGRNALFRDYRLRVAHVVRDYGLHAREQAPTDSRACHAPLSPS